VIKFKVSPQIQIHLSCYLEKPMKY